MRQRSPQRDFPGRRWLGIGLRAFHLAGVVLVAVALFGNGTGQAAAGVLLLASGLALYALELWGHPGHARELAGAFIPVKLLLVLWMVLQPGQAAWIFWLLLLLSAVVSHAPASLRHRRLG